MVRVHLGPLKISTVGQGVKTPPFHGGITGSNPVRTIFLEDYPSLAEGNGLENRQVCKSTQGFESLILLWYLIMSTRDIILNYRGVEQSGSSSGS